MLSSSHRVEVHLLRVGHCRHCERLACTAGRWRIIQFPAICALLVHPQHGAALFDTGYAERFFAATQPFPERLYRWITPMTLPPEETLTAQLARLGLRPADIRVSLISHLHADHIAGLRDLPQARFILTAPRVGGDRPVLTAGRAEARVSVCPSTGRFRRATAIRGRFPFAATAQRVVCTGRWPRRLG